MRPHKLLYFLHKMVKNKLCIDYSLIIIISMSTNLSQLFSYKIYLNWPF